MNRKKPNIFQPPPFYGWMIVAVSHLTLMVVFGVRLSFTVFFVALIDEFGWSRADTSLIFSTSMIVFAIASTLTGIALDRWGVRRTFGVGAVILSAGLLMSSRVDSIMQLAVAYGLVSGLGITMLGLGPQASLLARWFRRRRGMAIGIAFAGTGIGSLLIVPGVESIITNFGWRTAYVVLAGLTVVTIPLIVFLLRLNPEDKSLLPDGLSIEQYNHHQMNLEKKWDFNQAIRTPSFWLMMVTAMGAIGPVRMLTVHQLARIVQVGFERNFAAKVVGFSGVFAALAFILLGSISDKIDRRLLYMLGSFCLIGAIFLLGILDTPDQVEIVWVYAVLLGFGEGSRASMVTAVASDLFPGKALGAVNGAVGAFFAIGAAIMPWLAGLFFDLQATYRTGFIIAAGTVIVSTITLWWATSIKMNDENAAQSDHRINYG
jgi:MFS family permease